MKKIIIIYASVHHKNTEKLIEGIAKEFEIDFVSAGKAMEVDFSKYEIAGFASGIYMGKFHKSVFRFLRTNKNKLPKKLFTICTSGVGVGFYAKKFSRYLRGNGFDVLGEFECKGFDTFGISKIFGGFAKGHPDSQDIKNAVSFLKNIIH